MKKLSSLFIALTLVIGVVLGLSPVIVSAEGDDYDIQNPVISISSLPDKDIKGIEIMCDDVNAAIHEKDIWDAKAASKHKSKGNTNPKAAEAQDFLTYHIEMKKIRIKILLSILKLI